MQKRTLNHVDPDPDSRIPRTLNHVDNRVSCWQSTEGMWTLGHVNFSERCRHNLNHLLGLSQFKSVGWDCPSVAAL